MNQQHKHTADDCFKYDLKSRKKMPMVTSELPPLPPRCTETPEAERGSLLFLFLFVYYGPLAPLPEQDHCRSVSRRFSPIAILRFEDSVPITHHPAL